MAVNAWDVFVIEAGFVLKIASYAIAFGLGAYVGWKAKEMLSIFPTGTNLPLGRNPYPTGLTVSPVATGGMIMRVDNSGGITYVVPA